MGPVAAPGGIVNVTCVPVTEAGTVMRWPISTPMVPVRFVPLIVTEVPTDPLPGEIEVIVGFAATVNVPALAAVAAGLATLIVPLVAPLGTVNLSWVSETTVKGTFVP